MNLQELRDQRKRLADQAEEVLTKARTENRELLGDEEAQFDAIHADIEKLRKQIEREERQASVTASLDETSGRRSEPTQPGRDHEERSDTRIVRHGQVSDPHLEGLRSWLMAGCIGYAHTPEMRAAADRHKINLDAKQYTLQLSRSPLRSLTPDGMAEWRAANGMTTRAALGTSSGAIGGYTVADEMMKSLEVSLLAFGGMRQAATVLRTTTGADLPWPTMNDTANKGRIIGENSVMTNTDISFGQIVFQAFKYTSDYVLVSWEFLQDSTINAAEVIGKALGERIGRITNDHFTTGDASSKPNGIVTAAGAGVTATSLTATTTYSFLMDLVHSVDPAYRVNGKFMLSDAALKMVRKVLIPQYSGDTAGAPLWQPSLVAGVPDQLLGYPYVINQSMTAPATTVKSIIFGDLSKYMIRDVRDITLVRAEERFIEYGQVAFLAWSRHDGDLLDAGTDPVKVHTQG
jgi:HK97 family phage major capsid protein